MKNEAMKKRMWSKRIGDELYVFHNGIAIYKRWYGEGTEKRQPSLLFNKYFPNEWIV